ncbi:MAG: hypothetical protein HY451_00880 [Parcubacteria group bacterium]|nr:hypothetical protein [Parcubacteria group bacterium]
MDFLDFQLLLEVYEDLKFLVSFLTPFKWVVLPVLAFLIFLIARNALLFYRQAKFRGGIEWDMFEIRIPREIEKGPKAMDQFFAGLWTLINMPLSWKEKYVDGEVTLWFSFEIVGAGGKVHFYVRTPKKLRHPVESMLYAQYPDIEIAGAEDYTAEFPDSFDDLERTGYDLFGLESKLKNPSPNPINTYMLFEEKGGEERIIDPISYILEVMARTRPEERFWIQLVLRPAKPGWEKEGERIIKELKEKTRLKPLPGQPAVSFPILSPAEEESLKAISRKVSKRGFEVLIRLAYLAPKDIFDRGAWKNMFGYFNQYASSMNYFTINANALTGVRWWKWPFILTGRRTKTRKRTFLYRYKTRHIPEETFFGRLADPNRPDKEFNSSISILNSEELATLYHPPTNVVLTAPTLDRVESKKVSPPGYIPF